MIHVICGAPCAGKTTYVQKHSKRGELVIDTDKLAEALGADTPHMAAGACLEAALRAREAAIDYAKVSDSDTWIIHTLPSESQLREYDRLNAEIIVLDPGAAECKRRAVTRPEGTIEAIEKWYKRNPAPGAAHQKYWPERRKTIKDSGSDPRQQSVAENKEAFMKRTDITALFPQATDEQIKALMDLNGNDINNAKKDVTDIQTKLDKALGELDAAKTQSAAAAGTDAELAKAREQNATLEKELNAMKLSNQLRELRETVAKEKGVPAELLTGETEDACKTQADGILAFSKSQQGYPQLQDKGEAGAGASATGAPRDAFAAWAKDNL